ncbi:ATP-binding protein [Silvimonas soli]|uniref:ATP-binding protein n=1 Tax=Silvimonas soli TaxID=2980100 RepID=UPI0024B39B0E|nr:ATP-binding protein [Silvimonas soli]
MASVFLRDPHVVWRTTQLLFRNARLAQVTSLINASCLAFALRNDIAPAVLFSWWAVMALILLSRLWLAERYRQLQPGPEQARYWQGRFFVGVMLGGVGWFVGCLWFGMQVSETARFFIALLLAGMAAGSLPILAPSRWALRVYVALLISPMLVFAVVHPGRFGTMFGVLLLMFIFTLLRSASEYHHVLIETIGLDQEKGRLVADLKAATEELERVGRAKDEFLAAISHEIRTPMNGILGMAQLLASQPLPVSQREQVEVIRASTDALLAQINGVLDYSRIEAGHLELAPAPFAPQQVLDDLQRMFLPQAQAQGLQFICHMHDDVPAVLLGDATRLKQILVNLVGNALKFTRHGQVVINLAVRERWEGHVMLVGTVSDTGPGIPPEKRESIFLPFTQADSGVAHKYGGSGLGLSISRRLVGLMGGRLWVQDNPAGGSVFGFTAQLGVSGEPLPHDPVTLPGHALDVLVVDDNAVNCLVARRFLEKLGHRVTVAHDGDAALALVIDQPFDLVLMDVQMPVMDGLTAAWHIRQLEREIGAKPVRIVALSANTSEADREACMVAGMDDFLEKPMRQVELAALLGRL